MQISNYASHWRAATIVLDEPQEGEATCVPSAVGTLEVMLRLCSPHRWPVVPDTGPPHLAPHDLLTLSNHCFQINRPLWPCET